MVDWYLTVISPPFREVLNSVKLPCNLLHTFITLQINLHTGCTPHFNAKDGCPNIMLVLGEEDVSLTLPDYNCNIKFHNGDVMIFNTCDYKYQDLNTSKENKTTIELTEHISLIFYILNHFI